MFGKINYEGEGRGNSSSVHAKAKIRFFILQKIHWLIGFPQKVVKLKRHFNLNKFCLLSWLTPDVCNWSNYVGF